MRAQENNHKNVLRNALNSITISRDCDSNYEIKKIMANFMVGKPTYLKIKYFVLWERIRTFPANLISRSLFVLRM